MCLRNGHRYITFIGLDNKNIWMLLKVSSCVLLQASDVAFAFLYQKLVMALVQRALREFCKLLGTVSIMYSTSASNLLRSMSLLREWKKNLGPKDRIVEPQWTTTTDNLFKGGNNHNRGITCIAV